MFSFAILAAAMVLHVGIAAWATAAAARRVGSTRGRLAIALAAVVALQGTFALANGVGSAIATRLPCDPRVARAVVGLASISFSLGITTAALGVAFRLPFRRALAPLAAFFAVQIVAAAFAYGVLRPFCVESFVGSQSMAPTIVPTDRFLVAKLLAPRRGDLIVFRATPRGRGLPRPVYCKRLLGLPGERLCIVDGGLIADGAPVALPASIAGKLHAAPLSGGAVAARHAEGESFTLGPDEFFVVGDDADRSIDSRLERPVDRDAILGVVDAIYWPPARVRIFR